MHGMDAFRVIIKRIMMWVHVDIDIRGLCFLGLCNVVGACMFTVHNWTVMLLTR